MTHPGINPVEDYSVEPRYFHGREAEIAAFTHRLEKTQKEQSGTVFLFHGPPGVGKTALLQKCAKAARERGWRTVGIPSEALCIPEVLQNALETRGDHVTTLDVLQSEQDPLLLILERAEWLGHPERIPAGAIASLAPLLQSIHEGSLGRPVILLMTGLGMTKDVLDNFGVSRIPDGCFHDMQALGADQERAVLADWIVQEGGAAEDPAEWVDTMTEETYAWPKLMMFYAPLAARQIKEDGGRMTRPGLEYVMKEGRAKRMAYYEKQTEGMGEVFLDAIRDAFRDVPEGEGVPKETILESLRRAEESERYRKMIQGGKDMDEKKEDEGKDTTDEDMPPLRTRRNRLRNIFRQGGPGSKGKPE